MGEGYVFTSVCLFTRGVGWPGRLAGGVNKRAVRILLECILVIIDFAKIQKAIVRKPIEGRLLGVERVPYTKSLQVFDIGHITKDGLIHYFENKRSGGSGEVTVNVNRQQGYAIVTFENHVGKKIIRS